MTVALPSAPWSAAPRRRTGLLVPAAAAAALVAALAVAVAVTVLVLGRLPDRRESDLVLPALLGGAAGALVVVPLQRRAVAAARRLVRGEHRPMDDVLRTLGDLRPGVKVRQGQLIGLAGHSGKTATDRVRLELWREADGVTTMLDPLIIARNDDLRPPVVGTPLREKQLERFKAETAPWHRALRPVGP